MTCHRCQTRVAVHALGEPDGLSLGLCEPCNAEGTITLEEHEMLSQDLHGFGLSRNRTRRKEEP